MNAVSLSRSPHLSWVGFGLRVPPAGIPLSVCRPAKSFGISVMLNGRRAARWIHRGHEVRWTATAGAVHFVPADDEYQTCVMQSDTGCDLYKFWIPQNQFASLAASEGADRPVEWKRIAVEDDLVLRPCMNRLASDAMTGWKADPLRDDEAARQILLRIAQLHSGKTPDWQKDSSVFGARTLAHLVVYIDEHLRTTPSLSDMAALVGLSPSHFAKKFRKSTGLSLHRFFNQRRVQAALDALKADTMPLAHVAFDIGFSSQSHFTRVFNDLTGMTPAKYRSLSKRVVA